MSRALVCDACGERTTVMTPSYRVVFKQFQGANKRAVMSQMTDSSPSARQMQVTEPSAIIPISQHGTLNLNGADDDETKAVYALGVPLLGLAGVLSLA